MPKIEYTQPMNIYEGLTSPAGEIERLQAGGEVCPKCGAVDCTSPSLCAQRQQYELTPAAEIDRASDALVRAGGSEPAARDRGPFFPEVPVPQREERIQLPNKPLTAAEIEEAAERLTKGAG